MSSGSSGREPEPRQAADTSQTIARPAASSQTSGRESGGTQLEAANAGGSRGASSSGGGGGSWSAKSRDDLMSVVSVGGVSEPDSRAAGQVVSGAQVSRQPSAGGTPSQPSPQQQQPAPVGTTSSTQRLGSIEILNENKQRQLQLKQQESFKQHLEQRQKFIQQQQQEQLQQQLGGSANDLLFASPYRLETSGVLNYSPMASAGQTAAGQTRQAQQRSSRNPFDDERARGQELERRSGDVNDQASALSGKSGFLATLMACEEGQTTKTGAGGRQQLVDESGDELNSTGEQQQRQAPRAATEDDTRAQSPPSRYSKFTQPGLSHSYNYSGDDGGGGPSDYRPFYKRDLTSLLQDCRNSRRLVILIVAIALLLDNMLLTSVVPIIPAYLYKLRVEREHREQLEQNRSLLETNAAGYRGDGSLGRGRLDLNRDGKVDDDELEAELARRINQSLENVQSRFSGSFFHPRVVAKANADDDDDDDDDDQNDDDRSRAGRGGGDGDEDDDDDDDDDSNRVRGDRREATARARAKLARGRRPRASPLPTAPQSSAGRPKMRLNEDDYDKVEGDSDDDSEEDEGDDDGNSGGSDRLGGGGSDTSTTKPGGGAGGQNATRNGNFDRRKSQMEADSDKGTRKLPRKTAAVLQGDAQLGRSSKAKVGGGDRDDDDDDDDEDLAQLRQWQRVRASLSKMAQMTGNDTDTLGGMCLNMVLGRMVDDDDDDKDTGADQDVRGSNRRLPARPDKGAGGVGGERATDRADKDERQRAKTAKRPPAPKVERLRPRPSAPTPPASTVSKSRKPAGGKEAATSEAPDVSSPKTSLIGQDEVAINHQDIVDESLEVGIMFASKPIVQAIANPFVGMITNRVGFTVPMFVGFTIMFLSTIVFAFGTTYGTLFMARAIQGIGSACTSVAGMSMIADRFPDDAERGNAMAVALGGLALGVVIGPPFGGFMYEFFGKPSPFILLAGLALLDGLLQLLVLQPRVSKSTDEGASLLTLIKDPYILVAAGAITFANTGIGILEPALPLWMMDTMQAKNWEQGVAFLPAALSYLFSTNLFGNLGLRIGRWRSAMLGLIIIGCALLLIPFASRVDHLILPNGAIGFAIGMVDSTMMPMLGYLVDIRHTSVYGSVYAIGDVAFCASFVFGPALSGTLVELIGFEGLIITTALICFAFAPLLIMLKDPPARQLSDSQLQEQTSLRYVNFAAVGDATKGHYYDNEDEEQDNNDNNGAKTDDRARESKANRYQNLVMQSSLTGSDQKGKSSGGDGTKR